MAEVNKLGSDHIGLLVHGTFNVSIVASRIPSTYQFDGTAWIYQPQQGDTSEAKNTAPIYLIESFPRIELGTKLPVRIVGYVGKKKKKTNKTKQIMVG